MDMRNHGDSDWHAEHTYESMADDILRFADQQKIERFRLMGHSMGARTAMYVAHKYSERVDGIVCIDMPPVDMSKDPEFGKDAKSII